MVYTMMSNLICPLMNYPQMAHNLFRLPEDLLVHLSFPFLFLRPLFIEDDSIP